MLESRRKFLWGVAIAAPLLAVAAPSGPQQFPVPKRSGPPKPDDQEKEDTPPPGALKSRLEANDKDIKKKVEKLFQLASELKEQVEKTDSSQVLSLALVRKAEEIEKLAKEIKSRSAG
jgi:hypothetical protein